MPGGGSISKITLIGQTKFGFLRVWPITFTPDNQKLYQGHSESAVKGPVLGSDQFDLIDLKKMSDTNSRPELPDHLCIDERSPFYNVEVLKHDIGIRFNGKDRHDVEEYCLSEGWVKVPAGKTLDRKGNPLLMKLKGKLEVFYK
jgi:hypothetical protein